MRKALGVWVALARVLPIEVTSWWRPPSANVAAGGKDYSQHLVGTAIDALSPSYTRAQLLPLVQRVAALYGVSAPSAASEGSGRSVHVQALPYGTVQRLLTRDDPAILTAAATFVGPPRPLA
jgi:hypothetical protein